MSNVVRPALIKRLAKAYPRIGRRILQAHGAWVGATYPLRPHLMNAEPRGGFVRQRPLLDEVQTRTLSDVTQRGVAFVDIGDLVGGDVFDRLSKSAEKWLASDAVKALERAYPHIEPAKRWK